MSEYLCKLCHAMAVHIVTKCIVTLVRYPHVVECKAGLANIRSLHLSNKSVKESEFGL